MPPILIVIVNPRFDAAPGIAPVFIGMQVNVLILQAAPEPFHHDIIAPAASAVHGYAVKAFAVAFFFQAQKNPGPNCRDFRFRPSGGYCDLFYGHGRGERKRKHSPERFK